MLRSRSASPERTVQIASSGVRRSVPRRPRLTVTRPPSLRSGTASRPHSDGRNLAKSDGGCLGARMRARPNLTGLGARLLERGIRVPELLQVGEIPTLGRFATFDAVLRGSGSEV